MLTEKFKAIYESDLHKVSLKDNHTIIFPMLIFLILNTLKISVFNMYIIPISTAVAFLYKYTITLLLSAVLYLFIFRFKHRFVFTGFYLLQFIYIFANLAYYLYFNSYLQIAQSIVLLKEGMDTAGHFSIPKDPILFVVLIDLPFFIYIVMTYRKIWAFISTLNVYRKVLTSAAVLILLLTEGYNYACGYSLLHLAKDYAVNEQQIIERYGTTPNSFINYSMNRNEKKMIECLQYGKYRVSTDKEDAAPNIAVIQVESIDSNIINKKYKGKYIAPFLNSLSKENIYYPYVLSYHKAGGTSDSEFSIINSIEPLDDFPSMKLKSYMHPNSFMKILNDNLYTTIAFHGNVARYFSRNSAFPRMGFNEFADMEAMGLKDVGWGAPDKDVFMNVQKKTNTLQQPFFTYTITMTGHGPFTNAMNYYNNKHYNSVSNEVVKSYFNTVSYVDEALKSYVTYIRSHFENTYIFIWGDHTPNINTDEYTQASFIENSKYFEFVPLIIITPDKIKYIETNKVASFLDFAPTILEASGVPYKIRTDGSNLLDFNEVRGKIPLSGKEYDRSYLHDKIRGKK